MPDVNLARLEYRCVRPRLWVVEGREVRQIQRRLWTVNRGDQVIRATSFSAAIEVIHDDLDGYPPDPARLCNRHEGAAA
jgi:hypothetical protein